MIKFITGAQDPSIFFNCGFKSPLFYFLRAIHCPGGSMTDSIDVLSTLELIYTIYAVVILSLFAWLGFGLTRTGKATSRLGNTAFYGYILVLVFIGVSLHILTYNRIPWVAMDFNRDRITPDRTFQITAREHQFLLPDDRLIIQCGEKVLFHVESEDLTYGFGLVRQNNTLVFQMQVNPGSSNDLMWEFHKNEIYNIKSTEYSGPKGSMMELAKAVEVVGCETKQISMGVQQ